MNYIDLETWNRKAQFNRYLGHDFPYINIGADIDVANLYKFTKSNDLSFYFAMIFAANKIADSIENFKYRFKDGRPYIIERNAIFFTHMQPGSNVFVMVEGSDANDIVSFCKETKRKATADFPDCGFSAMTGRQDFINYSCIPWVKYNHFVRSIAKGGIDCLPKISWGKFEDINGKLMMPFSIQTHHGLMDGYHVGQYFLKLQDCLDNCNW